MWVVPLTYYRSLYWKNNWGCFKEHSVSGYEERKGRYNTERESLYPVEAYGGLFPATPKHGLLKPGQQLMCSSQSAL